jgi:thiol-disulfide isomerase/thioredoxin
MVDAQTLARFEAQYAPARTFIFAGTSKCPVCREYAPTEILVASAGGDRLTGGPVVAVEAVGDYCPTCRGPQEGRSR